MSMRIAEIEGAPAGDSSQVVTQPALDCEKTVGLVEEIVIEQWDCLSITYCFHEPLDVEKTCAAVISVGTGEGQC